MNNSNLKKGALHDIELVSKKVSDETLAHFSK